ncbi:hypothetical protein HanIR_Chr10g0460711 [Helianthus annuus]|nr:hypothetical protein HanIR_Chr10g0460711 [Helianthus annuus]
MLHLPPSKFNQLAISSLWNFVFCSFFFFQPLTESIPSTLETPTGQTEYSKSNPSPSPIPEKIR